jgi:hypothetical protein
MIGRAGCSSNHQSATLAPNASAGVSNPSICGKIVFSPNDSEKSPFMIWVLRKTALPE